MHWAEGPAFIRYRKDGTVLSETYYLHGQVHRAEGPSLVYYRKEGQVSDEYYYLHGVRQ